ncbi:MAG: methylase [Treponema sp.]|nr:methylase [Treponema sp.]
MLTSSVHNAWMRTVAGRLEVDYRYSKKIVYNNFPWPDASEVQKAAIEKTAQAILDTRAKYADCTMAQLYSETAYLFPELVKAHEANDAAVMAAYEFNSGMEESEIMAELFKMYEKLQFAANRPKI